jgi:hypothetical protein
VCLLSLYLQSPQLPFLISFYYTSGSPEISDLCFNIAWIGQGWLTSLGQCMLGKTS